ncbi:hypothetical protein [Peribacillus sp. SI8-4]|uniref:DUF6414 family protein n=1 Tax=Peribacillus sp. SI8-4 TaxID=3048009 RepID=UPI0025574A01|nr:hypothetical protein [Peribacillus sp. SI8-4]
MYNNMFKPRDFIYINQEKLNSYFSQLFGGLIRDIQTSETEEEQIVTAKKINAEVAGKFGLGQGSEKLLDFILGYLGKVEGSLKGNIGGEKTKTNKNIGLASSNRTLEHFQYSLLEESLRGTDFLIDLDEIVAENKYTANEIKEKLEVSHFIKFTAASLEITDYRNAINFANMIGRVIEHSARYIQGNYTNLIESYEYSKTNENQDDSDSFSEDTKRYIELIKDKGDEYLRKLSLASILNQFSPSDITAGNGEKFSAIVDVVNDVLSGEMIPLDILLKADLMTLNDSTLSFESQLKEKYLLEERTDLSFKYGYFEDTRWTIIGQITSLQSPSKYKLEETFKEFGDNITDLLSKSNDIELSSAVKGIIKEIDTLTKKTGLLPTVGENNIAITPIAIYIEPIKNPFK